MVLLIILILLAIILWSFYDCIIPKTEHFSNFNILNNGNFNEGKEIEGADTIEDNFKIVNLPNPSDSSYVLKQPSFELAKSYDINVGVTKNTFYYLSYWRSNDQDYDGLDNDIAIYGNDQKLTNRGKIIEEKTGDKFDGYKWKKIVYIINTSSFTNITIKLGGTGPFNSGFRVFADIVFRKYLHELPNYEYQDNLELICLVDRNTDSTTIKSKTGRRDIIFDKMIKMTDKFADLTDSVGKISGPDQFMGSSFSIIISYLGKNNDSGSIFKVAGNNDINSGVNMELRYGIGINNKLILTISNMKYIYDIGLATKLTTFFILYKDKVVSLYVDSIKLEPTSTNDIVEKKTLGTCPDSWEYLGDNKCEPRAPNKNKIENEVDFSNYNDNKKKKYAREESINWDNCKILASNELAPAGDSSCKTNVDLLYSTSPILINGDKSLKGKLKSVIVYKRAITEDEVKGIYSYLLKEYHDMNDPSDIYNRPSLLNDGSEYVSDIPVKPDSNPCPFENVELCKTAECSADSWEDIMKISRPCQLKVNSYCHANLSDNKCIELKGRFITRNGADMNKPIAIANTPVIPTNTPTV